MVLVASTPSVVWSSWWASPVGPVDQLFLVGFARVTNEPGVLSHACDWPRTLRRADGVLDPQDLCGTDCVRPLLQHGQRPQPQAVFRRKTKTRRSLSYPNQDKTLGIRRTGQPLQARLGQKHQFVHLCQQLERLQANANLARSLE